MYSTFPKNSQFSVNGAGCFGMIGVVLVEVFAFMLKIILCPNN